MNKKLSFLFVLALTLAGTSCGNSGSSEANTDSTKLESQKPESLATSDNVVKEGSRADIDGKNVVKIVTDETEAVEGSFEQKDWAAKSGHNVYDFSEAAEIKTYKRVVVTDPAKFDDTNRILTDTNFKPVWSENNTVVTVEPTFHGVSNSADDVLDMILEKKGYSYTAFMKDGSSIHVKH